MIESAHAFIEIAGWVALGALALVLAFQSRTMRAFTRARQPGPGTGPSVSVFLVRGLPDTETRRLISEVTANGYPGELEVVIVAGSPDECHALSQLTLASTRVRILEMAPAQERDLTRLAAHAKGEWLLVLPSSTRLESDAIGRLVSEATSEEADAIALLPRLDLRYKDLLLEPMIPWLRLTFRPLVPGLPRPDGSIALLAKTRALSGGNRALSVRILDGFDAAARGPLHPADRRAALQETVGPTIGRRLFAALALIALFAAPPVVAFWTRSFPWIVAAVVAYWLRFRVAARTGEPIQLAVLHPLASLAAAIALALPLRSRDATSSAETRT